MQNVECDDSNLDTTALSLAACVEENEYLFYASWEVRVYQSPFAILFDPSTNCVVVAIRGTLSIQVHLGSLTKNSYICTYFLHSGLQSLKLHVDAIGLEMMCGLWNMQ